MVDDQMTACFYTSPGEQEIKRLHTGTTGTRNAPAGAILVKKVVIALYGIIIKNPYLHHRLKIEEYSIKMSYFSVWKDIIINYAT